MRKVTTTFVLSILAIGMAMAQTDWNWPDDRATAEEKNVLYTDYLKQKNYKDAAAPFRWLLNAAPDLNEALYINGAKLYDGLQKIEEDPERKLELQDTAMMLYDMRIKYFNDKANVMKKHTNLMATISGKITWSPTWILHEGLNLFTRIH